MLFNSSTNDLMDIILFIFVRVMDVCEYNGAISYSPLSQFQIDFSFIFVDIESNYNRSYRIVNIIFPRLGKLSSLHTNRTIFITLLTPPRVKPSLSMRSYFLVNIDQPSANWQCIHIYLWSVSTCLACVAVLVPNECHTKLKPPYVKYTRKTTISIIQFSGNM